jgi:hypothetical protein
MLGTMSACCVQWPAQKRIQPGRRVQSMGACPGVRMQLIWDRLGYLGSCLRPDAIIAAIARKAHQELLTEEIFRKLVKSGSFVDVKTSFDRHALPEGESGVWVWRLLGATHIPRTMAVLDSRPRSRREHGFRETGPCHSITRLPTQTPRSWKC